MKSSRSEGQKSKKPRAQVKNPRFLTFPRQLSRPARPEQGRRTSTRDKSQKVKKHGFLSFLRQTSRKVRPGKMRFGVKVSTCLGFSNGAPRKVRLGKMRFGAKSKKHRILIFGPPRYGQHRILLFGPAQYGPCRVHSRST